LAYAQTQDRTEDLQIFSLALPRKRLAWGKIVFGRGEKGKREKGDERKRKKKGGKEKEEKRGGRSAASSACEREMPETLKIVVFAASDWPPSLRIGPAGGGV
ncbi:hypothetical protein FOL47_002550, partial [Perkinsus chesapeaki]